jgi:hypothetical protein
MLNLLFAMLLINVSTQSTVQAYQRLATGDELLYYVDSHYRNDDFEYYWYETDLSPTYTSWLRFDYNELDWIDVFGFYVRWTTDFDAYINSTQSYYDIYRDIMTEDQAYNYTSSTWYITNYNENHFLDTGSYFQSITYPVHNNTLNLDPLWAFGSTAYNYSTTISFWLNNIYVTKSVDVYTSYYKNSGQNPKSYLDINYFEDYTEEEERVYFVDPATGLQH